MTQSAAAEAKKSQPLTRLWRTLFGQTPAIAPKGEPLRSAVPTLHEAEIAAVYYDHRIGGDFYEFLRVSPTRVLFALLDVAGRHRDIRTTLVAAQAAFRILGPRLFGGGDFNESTAMMKLCYAMNATILEGGVRSCPAFLGCYNEDLGTVCYANAGHTPAIIRDGKGVTKLDATGLPLGLFSHTTQSAAACALAPGAALLVASRGIVESECAGEEFGIERTMAAFQQARAHSAHGLCLDMLQAVQNFTRMAPTHNDVTALVLERQAAGNTL